MVPQDSDILYRALATRDRRFDGRVFFGVRTTGIYCRPGCPAKTPLRKNVSFFATAAAAEEAGFRPCLRCRPETSPGTPAWVGSSATVTRALKLISAGLIEEEGLEGLAERLGLGERQLRRLFVQHLGAAPHAIFQTRRLDFARQLVDETELPIAEIAFASGFESLRRFNGAFKARFAISPTEARARRARRPALGVRIRLPFRPPYDWESISEFLGHRAIPGVEAFHEGVYSRSLELGGVRGWIEIRGGRDALELAIHGAGPASYLEIVRRVRGLFDLEADPLAIAAQLGRDPKLRPLLRNHPGLRVPGAWDGFELAVRAILGQQVSVAGARTLAGRVAREFGVATRGLPEALTHLFPTPERLAQADLSRAGIVRTRAEAIRRIAKAVLDRRLVLDPSADLVETERELLAIPGIGPWTAEYIAMRALRDPNAFPETDLVIRRATAGKPVPRSWEPWRAYATMYLWKGATSNG